MYVLLNDGSNVGIHWPHALVANEMLDEKIRIRRARKES